jgi:hypothetical protein
MNETNTVNIRQQQIQDFLIAGLKPGQIAERLDLTPSYISQIINAPGFQHSLAIRRARHEEAFDEKVINNTLEAAEKLKSEALTAANRMVQLLDSSNESVQFRAAESILDRTGVSKSTTQIQNNTVVILDKESAALIQESINLDKEQEDED